MSRDLSAELRSLQELLAGRPPASASRPPPAATSDDSSSDEDMPPSRVSVKIKSSSCTSAAQLQELERQAAALRQKCAEEGDRVRRLEAALEAAQQDGALVGTRLRNELAVKEQESAQLAEVVAILREEADMLRQQLQCATAAAQHSGQSAQASLAQLQAAAAEWRRQGEDTLEALAEERDTSASLTAEVHRLRAQADSLQRQLSDERQRAQAASTQLAAATATASPVVVADLRARLAQERAWRKAVCRWLEGEMATRADLERVLVNVGTAARTGAECGTCTSWPAHARNAPPPPLPPRRVAASQVVAQHAQHVQHAWQPGSPTVQVTVHSPPGGGDMMVGVDVESGPSSCVGSAERGQREGSMGGRRPRSSPARSRSSGRQSAVASCGSVNKSAGSDAAADWRDHFKATMQAFDERHSRLQRELSTLRREALLQAA